MSAAKVVFVLEGNKPEARVVERLQKAFPEELGELTADAVKIVYASSIYALYGALKEENGFLDAVEVLKERHPDDADLRELDREQVSQIFLFFDLDIHGEPVPRACEKLDEMLAFFNEETENGKLLLSYPMAETVDICDASTGLMGDDRRLFEIGKCRDDGFKRFVNDLNRDSRTVCHANGRENWAIICKANYAKAAWLLELGAPLPMVLEQMRNQTAIWRRQRTLIERDGKVATLSAFPFFLLEYLGAEKTCALCGLPRNGSSQ